MPFGPNVPYLGNTVSQDGLVTSRLRITCFSGRWAVPTLELMSYPDIGSIFQLGKITKEEVMQTGPSRRECVLLLREDDRLIGYAAVADSDYFPQWLDLRYAMHPDFRRQDYCSEGLSKLVHHLLEVRGIPGITAIISDHNAASRATARSIGMEQVWFQPVHAQGNGLFVIKRQG